MGGGEGQSGSLLKALLSTNTTPLETNQPTPPCDEPQPPSCLLSKAVNVKASSQPRFTQMPPAPSILQSLGVTSFQHLLPAPSVQSRRLGVQSA